jgi:[ribosomal protein S5]-alanine N-acetyltransferase
MFLKTNRLIIREFKASDLDDFAAIVADKEVMRFSLKGPLNKEEAQTYLQKRILDHYSTHGYGLWALIHIIDQCLIGFAGLMQQLIDSEPKVELGFRLAPSYWGQGLATEANLAIIQYAFTELGLKRPFFTDFQSKYLN